MQREKDPLHLDAKVLFQFFNTHGTEVAPRSDVIGKHFQRDRFGHDYSSLPGGNPRIAQYYEVSLLESHYSSKGLTRMSHPLSSRCSRPLVRNAI